mmetsp:Transcript_8781/g.15998  ORF Transcript_8781/g.15998 Transcript_8781/m.15998 type:complete len:337 (-) Transcript_8781:272-1282(-)|eukprot:CAMPEP_0201889772 /NCGR_PEP_ID=MMETSP0902-20130614/30812_1 /ASSEMBLY_ACC=CAM_ASM_000551 /TAXON_ID=420261 /ORGANISM="Thalassiosira antarctica, Strain CCMP982" /LENGTH=336 /DNA_ID=CAMNT_0048420447 /DNA_START=129 /DNA_END=1139 /DNA_ORIENTATION=-
MTSSEDDIFIIQLEDSRDFQTCFEVEKSGSLNTAFIQYSKVKGLSLDSMQFTYKGKTINPDESAASLGMSNDDNTIQVALIGQALTKETIAQACTTGSISTAIDLLSENNEFCQQPLSWFDSDGQELSTPPIFIAIDYGHAELVAKMLPLHKDILNTLKNDDDAYTPLQWASWTGNLDIVKLFVEEGGVNADEEALSLAREHDHNEVAEFLLKHVNLYSGLEGHVEIMEKACREGDVNKVRKLLEEVDIETWKDPDGKYLAYSPIHLAMRHGHMDLIQLFAEKGMEVDMTVAMPDALPKSKVTEVSVGAELLDEFQKDRKKAEAYVMGLDAEQKKS